MSGDKYASIAKLYKESIDTSENFERAKKDLIPYLDINSSTKTILDIGAGDGSQIKYIATHYPSIERAIGIDSSPTMIDFARNDTCPSNLDFMEADFNHIPIEDQAIDVAYGRYTLHHSTNLEKTMAEIARVVRPGGVFYIHDAHPISALFLKKSHNYEIKENVDFPAWHNNEIKITHPSFTFMEYISAIISTGWDVIFLEERYGRRSTAEEFKPYRIPTIIAIKLKRKLTR